LSPDQLLNGDTMPGLDHPAVWSSGPNFVIVPLTDRAALSAITIDMVNWRTHLGTHAGIYVVVIDQAAGQIDSRMFAPLWGINEDPATGSAAVALAGPLAATGRRTWTVHQGNDMGRPSTITLDITITGGTAQAVEFGGGAVIIANGTLTAPGAM
jgi:trans-2,3-dihydro-3-hydroxyanthranilate isomerase